MDLITRVINLTAHFEAFGILEHRVGMFFLEPFSEKAFDEPWADDDFGGFFCVADVGSFECQ